MGSGGRGDSGGDGERGWRMEMKGGCEKGDGSESARREEVRM